MSYIETVAILIFLFAGAGLAFSLFSLWTAIEERHYTQDSGLRHMLATASMRVHLFRSIKLISLIVMILSYFIMESVGKVVATLILVISITGCTGAILDHFTRLRIMRKIMESRLSQF